MRRIVTLGYLPDCPTNVCIAGIRDEVTDGLPKLRNSCKMKTASMGCNETIPSQHLENLWFCVFAMRGLCVWNL